MCDISFLHVLIPHYNRASDRSVSREWMRQVYEVKSNKKNKLEESEEFFCY